MSCLQSSVVARFSFVFPFWSQRNYSIYNNVTAISNVILMQLVVLLKYEWWNFLSERELECTIAAAWSWSSERFGFLFDAVLKYIPCFFIFLVTTIKNSQHFYIFLSGEFTIRPGFHTESVWRIEIVSVITKKSGH